MLGEVADASFEVEAFGDDRLSIKSHLSAGGIGVGRGAVGLINMDQHQVFTRGFGHDLGDHILVQEILIELDQTGKSDLLRPVFLTVFPSPGAIPFFDPERPERTASDWPATDIPGGIQQRLIKPDLIALCAMQFPPKITGKADANGQTGHPGHVNRS